MDPGAAVAVLMMRDKADITEDFPPILYG